MKKENDMRGLRMKALFLATLGLVLNGCNCNPAPVECNDITLTFRSPAAGATVASPFEAVVEARDSSGAVVEFDSATLEVGGAVTEGVATSGRATFSNVVAASGSARLNAKALRGTCERTAGVSVTVSGAPGNPQISKLEFPQDMGPDGVLNSAELPTGADLQVKVTAITTSGVKLRVKHNQVISALVPFAAGSAVANLPGAPAQDAAYTVNAELVKDSDGSVVDSFPANMAARGTIALNRQAPNCVNTTPMAPQGPRNDIDPVLAGHQFTGTFEIPVGATATAELVGVSAAPVALTGTGMLSARFTAPAMGDMARELRLVCKDSAGNTATSSVQVRIDYAAPVVSITSPSSADAGRFVVTASPQAVQVTTVGAENNSMANLFVTQGAARMMRGNGLVMANAVALAAPFALDGLYLIEVEVTDAAGNVGKASVPVDVQLVGCGMAFTMPMTCPAFVTTTSAAFATQSQARCAGQMAKLFKVIGATSTQIGMASLSATGAASFGTIALADGVQTIRAEVANPSGSVSSASCEVTVATGRPVIINPVRLLTGNNVINQTQDSNAMMPGAQKVLGFTAVVPTGGRVDLCADGNVAPAAAPACPGGPAEFKVLRANVVTGGVVDLPEGIYNIKIVVVSGAITQDSDIVPLEVDVTAPCVAAAGISLPQDTVPAGGDSRLNIAELGANAPKLAFSVDPACGAAVSALVRAASGTSVTSPVLSASLANPAGAQSIDLTLNIPTSGAVDAFVELQDAVGNTNSFAGAAMNSAARKAFTVDKVAPSCVITQPSKAGVLNTSDLMSLGGGNYRLAAAATTDADVATVSFQLAAATQSAPVTGQTATANFDTISGSQTGVALSASCTDAAGNSASASKTIDWDVQAPTCSFTAPAAASSTTNSAVLTSLAVAGADGRTVVITSSAQASDIGSLTVSAGVASGTFNYPNGAGQVVTGTVSDAAGNVCVATVTFSVASTSCDITLSGVYTNGATFWLNRNNTTSTGATTATADFAASSSCPAGAAVTLTRTLPTAGAPLSGSLAAGMVSFPGVAVADGEQYELTIAGSPPSTRTIGVDLVAPSVGAVSINSAAAPAIPLFFVANSGNRKVALATQGYIADLDGTSAGAQLNLEIAAVTGAFLGADNGKAEIIFKGSPIAAATTVISSSPQNVSLVNLTLPHPDNGSFVVRVLDQAGNAVDAYTQNATIDVVAPGAPVVTRTLVSARQGTVSLQWPSVTDATHYDVRWTTSSVFQNNAMASEADFFGPSSNVEADVVQAAGMLNKSFDLPPINSYYLAVRARDDVYNYSVYAAPAVLGNGWNQQVITGPPSSSFGEAVQIAKSLNNDANSDLVVSATSTSIPGAIHVYWGSTTFGSLSGCSGTGCQTVTAPASSGPIGVNFGSDFSVAGNVGDEAAEGKNDLVVGQPGFPTSTASGPGRILVYFGNGAGASITDTAFIEIRGDSQNRIGQTVRVIQSIDGDSLDEIAIAAPAFNANQGRVYLFKGRTAALWRSSRTQTDATSGAPYIPLSAADWIIEGPTPGVITNPAYFGRNKNGLVSVGDLSGDGKSEFTIGLGPSIVNRFQLWTSTTVAASNAATPVQSSAATQVINVAPTTDNNSQAGFGSNILAGLNVANGSANDLVVTWPAQPTGGAVYVYSDIGPSIPSTPALTLEGQGLFGQSLAIAPIRSAASKPDFLIGSGVVLTGATTGAYIAWAQPSGAYDTKFGSFERFWTTKFDGNAITGLTAHSFSSTLVLGDLNADTSRLPEVVIADKVGGKVYLWIAP
jgi:large repetitive protein